ncbi:MAG TPA: SpoIID/LytB domain-containing protein [Calditrichia bacterium]|nr:SpoIID/LytB domain-containing protein [Calditrichia bacterium]HQV30529.1 SpoIID/LytB domain-containing protein [Calditrichia bacterium]
MERIDLPHLNGQPIFRIGLFSGQEHIDFRVEGKFKIQDGDKNDLITDIRSDIKWRIKIKESRPGKERFFLLLYESHSKEAAEEKFKIAKKMAENVTMICLGGDTYLDGRKVNDNRKYALKFGSFSTEIAARKAFKQFQPDFIPRVEKEQVKTPGGQLEIFDAEYDKSAEVSDVIRIVPEDVEAQIKIFQVRTVDDILQRDNFSDLFYNGTMEFRFDISGQLMGVSELPLESYLKRVIYSESGTSMPLEFVKSLAIVCRSEAMARIQHRRLGDPFDYNDFGETLRYYGTDFTDEIITKGVEATKGQVVISDGLIRDTPFHLISGGHTEDEFQEDEGPTHFKGKYNGPETPKGFKSLKDDAAAEKWITSRPDTWCNLKGREVPEALENAKKYFRWEVDYSRRELEDLIRKKTGEDIGILFEIIPHSRGASGRLKEIELIGSLKNYRIRGELNIREALSYDYLPSSCFVVERELDDSGTPISFTFVGAGQGHGVGMCKTGAAVMAMENYTFDKILKHYFEECELDSIYSRK